MSEVLKQLDSEWRRLARSPQARRALMRWKAGHPALSDLDDFEALLTRRQAAPADAPALLAALAALAPSDELAARVLLQALVPGLIRLSLTAGYGDRTSLDDMISLAWERIRTYPPTRHGHVAANVLRDVRKRYRHLHQLDKPCKWHQRDAIGGDDDNATVDRLATVPSSEDVALQRIALDDLVAAQRQGVISEVSLRLIVQTRILGEPVSELAARSGINRNTLMARRFRAERRLRELQLAG